MKKTLALMCTLALGLAALAGCSDNNKSQSAGDNGSAAQSTSTDQGSASQGGNS
jgi:outer membrane protein assembly factor BamE (lipoprotein component of BamABCDE complex)